MNEITSYYFSFATWLIRKLQKLLGASTVGVRALVINSESKVLLVKHTYLPEWHFPGGGVDQGETAVDAVIRELKEETGVVVHEKPQIFGVYFHQVKGVNDYPILYVLKKFSQEDFNSNEIAEAKWFSLKDLPEDTSQSTLSRLQEFFENKDQSPFW